MSKSCKNWLSKKSCWNSSNTININNKVLNNNKCKRKKTKKPKNLNLKRKLKPNPLIINNLTITALSPL